MDIKGLKGVGSGGKKRIADRQSRDPINRRNADLNADLRAAAKCGVGSCSGWYNGPQRPRAKSSPLSHGAT